MRPREDVGADRKKWLYSDIKLTWLSHVWHDNVVGSRALVTVQSLILFQKFKTKTGLTQRIHLELLYMLKWIQSINCCCLFIICSHQALDQYPVQEDGMQVMKNYSIKNDLYEKVLQHTHAYMVLSL